MIIDVQDSALNVLLNACLYGLAALAVLAVIPWPLRDRRNRWTLWLPLVALGVYAVYERAMPARMDIRLDLVLIGPLLLIILAAWLIRLILVRRAH